MVYKCLNCGGEIPEIDLAFLRMEEARLNAGLEQIQERISAIEIGFCDGYCWNTAEGE